MAQAKLELTNLAATQDLTGQVRKAARDGSASAANTSTEALSTAESSQGLAQNLTAVVRQGLEGARAVLAELRGLANNYTNATGTNATIGDGNNNNNNNSANGTTTLSIGGDDDGVGHTTTVPPGLLNSDAWRPDLQSQPCVCTCMRTCARACV